MQWDVELPECLTTDALGAQASLEAKFVKLALEEMRADGLPQHRVTVLAERGVKTRTVTVGPAHAQILGHCVRKRLARALRHCPGTWAPLQGASDEQLVEHLVGGHGEILVSTDLTRATDLLPFDLLGAVISGLEESGRMSALEVEILRYLSGAQRLTYPDGETVTTSRGALMGLPTSWCLLSLVHLWWMDSVRRTSKGTAERQAHRFHICGDDALLATTRVGGQRYKSLVLRCGGAPSEGKHFESSRSPAGTVRGVFLERLFEFDVSPDTGRLVSGVRARTIAVKGLTSRSLPRTFIGDNPIRCNSAGIVQVVALDALATGPHAD